MKLTVLSLAFSLSAFAANVDAQQVSVSVTNAKVKTVLNTISQQTGLSLAYSAEVVDLNRKVSMKYVNTGVDQVLTSLFNNTTIGYKIENGKIYLFNIKSKESPIVQQSKNIKGSVVDSKGEPVIGANVVVKGTTTGTITDMDGNFSLSAPQGSSLVVSYIGYSDYTVKVGTQNSLKITLTEDNQALDEVVVIGYGVAKKSDLTGAITQVKAEKMQNYTPSNVGDLLRTNIPGMKVGYSTSAKGNADMNIRGETTLTAGSGPLIVVDGSIYNGDISDINPSDIERMDVMKDASSAAVYGSRATNGVVSITTKKGVSNKPVINFSGTIGAATASKRAHPYDADGFIQWRSDMFKSIYSSTVSQKPWSPFDDPRKIDQKYLNDWIAFHGTSQEYLVDAWLSGLRLTALEIENYKAGKAIDWEDQIFHTGLRQDYNLSLSGRNKDFSYYWSLGYMDNEALTIGDEFSTIRSRVNIEGKPAKFLKVGLNAQFSYRDESSVPVESSYNTYTPYSSLLNDDGSDLRLYPNDDNGGGTNPLLTRKYRNTENEDFTFFPKIYATLQLPFGITYTMNYTTRFVFHHTYTHNSSLHPEWGKYGGSASRANALNREWQVDNIINWNKTFLQKHKFDFTFLYNAEKYRSETDRMSNKYFSPNDKLGYHNMTVGTLPEISSNDAVRTGTALMGRLNYTFNNKYLATVSVRRDGSSLFGYSNPHANFPAAALGWVISEEPFFKNNIVDYLKLRLSWGVNGNRNIQNYAALSQIVANKTLNADQNGNAIILPMLNIAKMENKGLKWERTEAYNIAADFQLLKGILGGSIELYNQTTTDVLVNRQLPILTGYQRVYANLGEVKNRGFELSLNSNNLTTKNFDWKSNFIFSLNRNKIESIVGDMVDVYDENGNVIGQKEPDDKANNWFIGHAKDIIWDYKILGTWKTGQEDEAAKWNQKPGDFRIEDVNNDGLLTDDDKQFLGYKTPRFSWTLTNTFTLFKDFEFSFILYSLWGHKGALGEAKHDNHKGDRCNAWELPYWTPDNQIDNYCRLRSAPANGVFYNAWFDKSYIRLENVALAYKVPKRVLAKTFISNIKFYFNIRNAAVWAPRWDLGDPESGTRAPRIYTFGLNMTL